MCPSRRDSSQRNKAPSGDTVPGAWQAEPGAPSCCASPLVRLQQRQQRPPQLCALDMCVRCVLSDLLLHMPATSGLCPFTCKQQLAAATTTTNPTCNHHLQRRPVAWKALTPTLCLTPPATHAVRPSCLAPLALPYTMGLVIHCPCPLPTHTRPACANAACCFFVRSHTLIASARHASVVCWLL